MANAGRILIIPRGVYDATTTYEILDLVSYNGTSWLAKKTSIGIEPSEANSEYWQNMFESEWYKLHLNKDYANPLITGDATLREYILRLLDEEDRVFLLFSASDFSDLPIQNWTYAVEVIRSSAIYVKIYRTLSSGIDYYIREIGTDSQWMGEWKRLNYQYPITNIIDLTSLDSTKVYEVSLSIGDGCHFVITRDINRDAVDGGGMYLKVEAIDTNWGNYPNMYDITYNYVLKKNLKSIVGGTVGNIILYLRGGLTYTLLQYKEVSFTINTTASETYSEEECMEKGFYKGFDVPNITADTPSQT